MRDRRPAVPLLTRHSLPAPGSTPQLGGSRTLGRRSPQLRHRRPQLGLSSSGDGEASAAESSAPEPESPTEVSETSPLVQTSDATSEVKEESGAAEFSAAFYRTRLITFAAMVTGCAAHLTPSCRRSAGTGMPLTLTCLFATCVHSLVMCKTRTHKNL